MKNKIYIILPIYRFIYHLLSSLTIESYLFILKIKLHSLGKYCRINFADIAEPYNVTIGHHVFINKNCQINTARSKVDIGNYVMIGPGVSFIAQDHDISNWKVPMIYNFGHTRGDIKVEDDVWIGANAIILRGVTIKRGSVVAAGAVVTKDVPEYSIVGGIPAVKIKDRFPKDVIKEAVQADFKDFDDKPMDWLNFGVSGVV